MDSIFSNISITILTAIISGFLGAWFQYWFLNRKVNKVRGIAIKALKIFQGYAKKKQTFDMVASEFNNKIDIVEKRAVLVALCKLGIPVARPVDDSFHIENVRFEHEEIDKETIELMIGQVNKGNCDDLFFSDVEAYFSSNTRLMAVRAVAKKYVDVDFAYCYYDKQKDKIMHTKIATDLFTPGELNILTVFKIRSSWDTFFDENGKVVQEKLDNLKKEIDLGIWDTYLFWDSESYLNIQTQNKMANVFTNAVLLNLEAQQKGQTNKEMLDEKLDKILYTLSEHKNND